MQQRTRRQAGHARRSSTSGTSVQPLWTVEEYTATFRDDDIRFVGAAEQSGLFTPNVDGPNPKRSGNRNNVGDVWVVASMLPAGGRTVGEAAAGASAPAR